MLIVFTPFILFKRDGDVVQKADGGIVKHAVLWLVPVFKGLTVNNPCPVKAKAKLAPTTAQIKLLHPFLL